MPQQSEAKFLGDLTEVPAGWPLATVIDAFAKLAACHPACADTNRALEALGHRLVDLWASQPAEAQAWRELHAKEATRPEELQRGAAPARGGPVWEVLGRPLALLRGRPPARRATCGSAAEREDRWAASITCSSPTSAHRCRELAERLAAAETQETARKRQKLEEETAERRRLEAELQKSQEEGRELSNRLAAAEAEAVQQGCGAPSSAERECQVQGAV